MLERKVTAPIRIYGEPNPVNAGSSARCVRIAGPIDQEKAITDILVAREMARIDLGVDILIAQPRS
jgi:hypothetical protein